MLTSLLRGIQSEWLKTRRSLASWLVVGGGLFIPAILFAVRLRRHASLPAVYRASRFWETLWGQAWESMAIMIVPIVVILATSLIIQLEYRNDTWKQLHASPQSLATIFLAKLTIILALVLQFLAVFNIGIYLTGIGPALLFKAVTLPTSPIPFRLFLERNLNFFVESLPIVAIQYLLALRFRNFMVPLGVGMALWVFSIGTFPWQYNYLIPYSYCGIDYLIGSGMHIGQHLPASIQILSLAYFVAFVMAGFGLYVARKDRG